MRASLLALGLLVPALALADEPKPDPKKAEQFLAAGFKERRGGHFDTAAAFIDEAVKLYPPGEDRKRAALDGNELARIQKKWDKAARLGRQAPDLERECEALVKAGRAEQGLKLAREAKDPLVEARVLRLMGKDADALAAFEKAGTQGADERGELLMKAERFADAAKAFEQSGDLLRRAVALEKAKDASAPVQLEAAKVAEKGRLEAVLAQAKTAKAAFEAAAAPVAKDRARFALAELHGKLVVAYERYATAHERTGDRATARKLVDLALQFAKQQRVTLTDSGADQYGIALAKDLGLEAREKSLEERAAGLK